MKSKSELSGKANRIQLFCTTLDILACEAMECIEHKEGSIGNGEFPAWIQLSYTQQLLVLNRLAECIVEGKLGFCPQRSYGDAAIRVIFNALREELGFEFENDEQELINTQIENGVDKDNSKTYFRDLIAKSLHEIQIIDSIDNLEQFDDLDDAIWEIEESFVHRSDHDAIEPYFWSREKLASDEYWSPLEYHPADHATGYLISRIRSTIAPWVN